MTENKDPQYYKLRYIFISLYLKEHEKRKEGYQNTLIEVK